MGGLLISPICRVAVLRRLILRNTNFVPCSAKSRRTSWCSAAFAVAAVDAWSTWSCDAVAEGRAICLAAYTPYSAKKETSTKIGYHAENSVPFRSHAASLASMIPGLIPLRSHKCAGLVHGASTSYDRESLHTSGVRRVGFGGYKAPLWGYKSWRIKTFSQKKL